jgi:hypothetical protein
MLLWKIGEHLLSVLRHILDDNSLYVHRCARTANVDLLMTALLAEIIYLQKLE